MDRFNGLPAEVRCIIIEAVVHELRNSRPLATRKERLVGLAVLNREWQRVVEQTTFLTLGCRSGKLRLTNSDLDNLEKYMVGPRCRNVGALGFQCAQRPCRTWDDMMDDVMDHSHPQLYWINPVDRSAVPDLSQCLQQLFKILASWEDPERNQRSMGLGLGGATHCIERPFSTGLENLNEFLKDLETISYVTRFSIQSCTISIVPLVTKFPRLRILDILCSEWQISNWKPLDPIISIRERVQDFFRLLAAAAPNLDELRVRPYPDDDSQIFNDNFVQEFFASSMEYAKSLSKLSFRGCGGFVQYPFLPFWDTQDDVESTGADTWPLLTHFSIEGNAPCTDGNAHDLFQASCRAMACMPRIKKFKVNTSVLFELPGDDFSISIVVWTTNITPGKNTTPRAHLSVNQMRTQEFWPSREALGVWRESISKLELEPDDISDLEARAGGSDEDV